MGDDVDVLIIGAGLSGIGAAWRLRRERPGTTFAIAEARDDLGGTWDLFRYPGVRSDSDMYTMSYPFRPWREERSLAAGSSILRYIRETATEGGILPHIRFATKVLTAAWEGDHWSATTTKGTINCRFLYACAGYYDYDRGHEPVFGGAFDGPVVHPQSWPPELDHAGKRVVVIGSGATAVTLVPAMAATAAHVTMLQRSPSYVASLPASDPIARVVRKALPPGAAHHVVRVKNVLLQQAFYRYSRWRPERTKAILRRLTLRHLKDPALVDEHFRPAYDPWDQRLCVVPQGDLFTAVTSGRADIVTATIDRLVPEGVRLTGGRVLPADIIVSATGLRLLPLGGVRLSVDGEPVDLADRVAYRGVLLDGVPNFAFCIGYTNASWTLRADLLHRYVCRLLAHLDRHGYTWARPRTPAGPRLPILDFTSSYVRRSLHLFPWQSDRTPWRIRQNYLAEALTLPHAGVRREMEFGRSRTREPQAVR